MNSNAMSGIMNINEFVNSNEFVHILFTTVNAAIECAMDSEEEEAGEEQEDHRKRQRSTRRDFQPEVAKRRLIEDFLSADALFNGSEFQLYFRLSRGRFQCLMEDIGNSGDPFYTKNAWKKTSLEALLLLPIKSLAYGVPSI